jgi:hypothetical protein
MQENSTTSITSPVIVCPVYIAPNRILRVGTPLIWRKGDDKLMLHSHPHNHRKSQRGNSVLIDGALTRIEVPAWRLAAAC